MDAWEPLSRKAEIVRSPVPLDDLAGFRAVMPRLPRPSAELLRETRDEEL